MHEGGWYCIKDLAPDEIIKSMNRNVTPILEG